MKVIDACMFSDELDTLELRLNELDSVVDHFVIVEGLETFGSGKPRAAVLAANWEVVKPFEHKVKYITVPRLEPAFTDPTSGWQRERFLRNQLWPGVLEVSTSAEDVVIVADVDEIPRAKVIRECIPQLVNGMHRLDLDWFYYNFNWSIGKCGFATNVGTVAQYTQLGGPHEARSKCDAKNTIRDAGWHLSYFGGLKRIRTKIETFSHASDDFCQAYLARTDNEAAIDIMSGHDIFRTRGLNQFDPKDPNDPKLPAYFLANRERFRHFVA